MDGNLRSKFSDSFKMSTSDALKYILEILNTVKPLNSGHSRSPKFCPLFGGVRYSEGIHF
jgi:hypothetical protein